MLTLENNLTLTSLFAFIIALLVAFASTPAVKMLAVRIKAVDVPKDAAVCIKYPFPVPVALPFLPVFW